MSLSRLITVTCLFSVSPFGRLSRERLAHTRRGHGGVESPQATYAQIANPHVFFSSPVSERSKFQLPTVSPQLHCTFANHHTVTLSTTTRSRNSCPTQTVFVTMPTKTQCLAVGWSRPGHNYISFCQLRRHFECIIYFPKSR